MPVLTDEHVKGLVEDKTAHHIEAEQGDFFCMYICRLPRIAISEYIA